MSSSLATRIDELRAKHNVQLASVCVMAGGEFEAVARGGEAEGYDASSLLQIASLSKTIGTAFTLQLLRERGIPLSTPVNDVLARYTQAAWRAQVHPDRRGDRGAAEWPDALRLEHLANHSGGLGLHYVNGIPGGADGVGPMPSPDDLLLGRRAGDLGYPEIFISTEPGTRFAYSGAGFLVLQIIAEGLTVAGKGGAAEAADADGGAARFPSLEAAMAEFLTAACGEGGVTFSFPDPLAPATAGVDGPKVVRGRREDGSVVHPFLRFPAFAAGGVGTPRGVCQFLHHLVEAYWRLDGSGPVAHDTAVAMLHGVDRGSVVFIGAAMGLGAFVTWAGDNGVVLHQAANDGFRGVYVACFRGPDAGKGFCVLNNGDDNGTRFNAELLQFLFRDHPQAWRHVDFAKFRVEAGGEDVPQEEVVNDILRACVFEAFEPHLPEALGELLGKQDGGGAADPHPVFSLPANAVVGATVEHCTDQGFSRAENLVSPLAAKFDPTLFGRQGKVMDSWESVRHNPQECDVATFALAAPVADIKSVVVSTEYHDGNHGEFVSVDVRGADDADDAWQVLLPKRQLTGHSMHFFSVQCPATAGPVAHVRVKNYPDGGITRIGLFPTRDHHAAFGPNDAVARCESVIPHVEPSARVNTVWAPSRTAVDLQAASSLVNIFSRGNGASIGGASNERFGPADACISDAPPAGMFDGCETARSRGADHHDWVVIHAAAEQGRRRRDMAALVVDFTFFRNNNPVDMALLGWVPAGAAGADGEVAGEGDGAGCWRTLVPRFPVKAYAGNAIAVAIPQDGAAADDDFTFTKFKVQQFPDGGFNRVRLLCKPSE